MGREVRGGGGDLPGLARAGRHLVLRGGGTAAPGLVSQQGRASFLGLGTPPYLSGFCLPPPHPLQHLISTSPFLVGTALGFWKDSCHPPDPLCLITATEPALLSC